MKIAKRLMILLLSCLLSNLLTGLGRIMWIVPFSNNRLQPPVWFVLFTRTLLVYRPLIKIVDDSSDCIRVPFPLIQLKSNILWLFANYQNVLTSILAYYSHLFVPLSRSGLYDLCYQPYSWLLSCPLKQTLFKTVSRIRVFLFLLSRLCPSSSYRQCHGHVTLVIISVHILLSVSQLFPIQIFLHYIGRYYICPLPSLYLM